MSIKLKALGLTLLTALAVSGVASMSASATGTGHFTFGETHTIIDAFQEGDLNTFTDPVLPPVTCETANFEATAESAQKTATELTVFATFHSCHTSEGVAHVAMNGCHFVVTIETHSETTDNKVHLVCPGLTKHVTIRRTNFSGSCTITVGPQTPSEGISYTTKGEEGPGHDVTVDATISGIVATRHADGFGACLFAATNTTGSNLVGEVTARGFNTDKSKQVSFTATGSTGV